MKPVSPSAKGVAFLRYLEEAVSGDTLAKYFTDEEGKRVVEQWLNWCPYVGRLIAIRGRYIEDMVAEYIQKDNITQTLNIAAGLNTFPYRHTAAPKLHRYAELDLPPMLEFKKAKIAELKARGLVNVTAPSVEYYPVDLSSNLFSDDFRRIPWDWQMPSIYVFEGMSYYLPKEKLQQIIDLFADTMVQGSVLVLDYFPDFVKTNQELNKIMDGISSAGGEDCFTYLSKQEATELLHRFNIISNKLESDLEVEYYPDKISKHIGSIIVAEMKCGHLRGHL